MKEKKTVIPISTKQEIVTQHNAGVKISALVVKFNLKRSTISAIVSQKDAIMAAKVTTGVSRLHNESQRNPLLNKVEEILHQWMAENEKKGIKLKKREICRKAKLVFKDLKGKTANTDTLDFKASNGWFTRFSNRANIHMNTHSVKEEEENSDTSSEFRGFTNSEGEEEKPPEDSQEDDEVPAKKSRKTITLEKKREIISRKDAGAKNNELSVAYGLSRSTISTIIAQRSTIMKNESPMGFSRLAVVRQRKTICAEMEDMLMVWIIDQQMKGHPNTQEGISNQARIIFDKLKTSRPTKSSDEEIFKASRGWFSRFETRGGLQKITITDGTEAPIDGKLVKPRVLYIVKPSEIEEDRKLFTCPRCSCETKGRKEFLKHLSHHTSSTFVGCKVCEEKFPSQSALDVHMKTHEEAPKEYPCDICGGRYKFLSSFLKHLKIHEEEAALLRENDAEQEIHVEQDSVADEDPLKIKAEYEEVSDVEVDERETQLSTGNFFEVLIKTEG